MFVLKFLLPGCDYSDKSFPGDDRDAIISKKKFLFLV